MPDQTNFQKESIRTSASSESSVKDNPYKTDIGTFLDQSLKTNPFGQNLSGEHVYRRAERIAAALHLLTAHVSFNEPVRTLIRKESIMLLHQALALRSELRVLGSEIFKRTQASIRTLISLSRLLGISGFASVQNTQLLVDSLDDLGTLLLTSQRSSLSEDSPLSREDLMPRRMDLSADTTRVSADRVTVAHKGMRRGAVSDRAIKDAGGMNQPATHNIRAERIFDILKSGVFLGIKDIASNLPEYSEKMIQRELATQMSVGRVKKIGAKRWSKYCMVKADY